MVSLGKYCRECKVTHGDNPVLAHVNRLPDGTWVLKTLTAQYRKKQQWEEALLDAIVDAKDLMEETGEYPAPVAECVEKKCIVCGNRRLVVARPTDLRYRFFHGVGSLSWVTPVPATHVEDPTP